MKETLHKMSQDNERFTHEINRLNEIIHSLKAELEHEKRAAAEMQNAITQEWNTKVNLYEQKIHGLSQES